jgi:prophage regulatory protein
MTLKNRSLLTGRTVYSACGNEFESKNAPQQKKSALGKVLFWYPCPKIFASLTILLMLDLYSMSADPHPRTILRIEEVLHRTGLKHTMFYDLIKKRKFPKQVTLGARAVGWYEHQVDEWIRNRDSAKRQPERPSQTVTDGTEMPPTKHLPSKSAMKAMAPNPAESKLSAAIGAPVSTVRTAITGRRPTPGINMDSGRAEAMTESEELRLLRTENAQLKELVGELVLKNSLLRSAAGLKASNL